MLESGLPKLFSILHSQHIEVLKGGWGDCLSSENKRVGLLKFEEKKTQITKKKGKLIKVAKGPGEKTWVTIPTELSSDCVFHK